MLQKFWQWLKKLYRQWFWRSQHWLNYADLKRRNGEWETAISAYNRVIEIEPNHFLAWRKKAYTLSEMGLNEEALSCYEKAVRINHDDVDVWCEKAEILTKLKRYQFAITAYGNALQINPQLASAWVGQGDLLLKIQQDESALHCYEEALNINPDDEELRKKKETLSHQIQQEKKIASLFTQVEEFYQQKNYEQVVNLYDQILEIKPHYELGWDHQGHSLLELGQYDRALTSLNQALKIREDHPEVWYFKGRTLENMGEFAEALIAYNQALELDKKYYQAWDGKAITLSKLDQDEEAFKCWEIAFEINPNYFQGWLNKGLILLTKEKYNLAKENFDKALELNPNYYHGWLCQARLHADYGRYQEALKIWDQVFERDKEKIKYLENRILINLDLDGEILNYAIKIYKSLLDKMTIYAQRKREVVNQLLDKALTLNPQCAKAWWYKGKAIKYSLDLSRLERDKLRLNCYFKALLYFNKSDQDYQELYQEHLFVKNNFACDLNEDAQEHIKAGEFQEAIDELGQSIEIFKDLNEHKELINSYRLRGNLYTQLGKYQEAISDFDNALLYDSDSHHLTYCERGLAYQLLGEIAKAIEDYSLAIEIKPSFESYNSRGLLYNEQGEFESAIEDFNEAINLKPSEANCFYSRGFAKAQLEQNEAAIDDFLQAAELYRCDDNMEAYRVAISAVEHLKALNS